MGNQGVSHGNRSASCAWSASNWLGVQISALIWFLIIILCSVSSRTLAEPRRERESRAGREFHASRALKYAARYFLLLLRAKFAVYVCMARCVCVWVCVWCAAVYYYFTCAIFCHVPFRFVWFGFVLVFVFMLLFFRLPSLRHSSIIHIDFFCFSPLPTPPALLCSFSSCFWLSESVLCLFFCTLLFALWPLRLRFTCKQLTEFHREMHKEKSGICWGYGEKWSLSMIKRSWA